MNKFVTYESFGAVGDGVTEDFAAIYAAHVYANEHGLPVKARAGAKYYIHHTLIDGEVRFVPIKTDVDWTGAEIIIDDSDLDWLDPTLGPMCKKSIFEVIPDSEMEVIEDSELLSKIAPIGYDYGTKKIDLGLGYQAMLVIYNDDHHVYRRNGVAFAGQYNPATDLIVVDEDGNVSDETPFMFNYPSVTKIEVVRTDVTPITIKGGVVRTVACGLNIMRVGADGVRQRFGYFNRGLCVSRSYTTVDGVHHIVEGEVSLERQQNGEYGAHYNGFFRAMMADTVIFKNCILQGRRYYGISGTYDFSANVVNNITLINCKQSNFWIDSDGNPSEKETGRGSMDLVDTYDVNGKAKLNHYCWGIGGTSFCKNMNYIGCRISRFDAHRGLYNGTIEDCEIQMIAIIGKGDINIKNVTLYTSAIAGRASNPVITLRHDYGSTWEGTIHIDGLRFYTMSDVTVLLSHYYKNWNFGYDCHMPNLEVSNLKVLSKETGLPVSPGYRINVYSNSMIKEPGMHKESTENTYPMATVFSEEKGKYVFDVDESRGYANDNIIVPPEFVRINDNEGGYIYFVPDGGEDGFLAKTEITVPDGALIREKL